MNEVTISKTEGGLKMTHPYILSIDQSTQGTKAMLLDEYGSFLLRRDVPHRQIISDSGWVGHDASEIAANIFRAARFALQDAGVDPAQVAAVAVTNQRESVAVWDRRTGEPVCESIVWQCNRATELCRRLTSPETERMVREKTGLQLSPFFSAPKVAWILENVPGARERAERGELCLGTMDTWTIWQLTGGAVHRTDASNASRTQLFNIRTMQWDEELCRLYGIPMSMLPEVCDSDALYGETDLGGLLPHRVPIHAAIGDSHGVMFSHGCTELGDAMCGYGTGSCMLMNTGERVITSRSGMNATVAWRVGGRTLYALEGVANSSGSVVTWLKENAHLVASPAETAALARSANPADHTYMVPAFTGIGAPYWREEATAAFLGMTRLTGQAELVRAALESIAYQIADLVRAAQSDSGTQLREFRVAGGPTNNDYLMQFQSDLLGCPVVIAGHEELSGIGAGYIAGIAMGLYDYETLLRGQENHTFRPQMSDEERAARLSGWDRAVQAVLRY